MDALDGNAAAGTLAEVLSADMTTAITICEACGAARQIGELRAYLQAPGIVLRCASCEAVQMRFVVGPARGWVDLRGVRSLQVGLP